MLLFVQERTEIHDGYPDQIKDSEEKIRAALEKIGQRHLQQDGLILPSWRRT
jgi:hypothetical protein